MKDDYGYFYGYYDCAWSTCLHAPPKHFSPLGDPTAMRPLNIKLPLCKGATTWDRSNQSDDHEYSMPAPHVCN